MIKLSILICTIPSRKAYFERITGLLQSQMNSQVEMLYHDTISQSIGAKRNQLVKEAKGQYIAHIDDDDTVSPNYISDILKAIKHSPDCCSLIGIITTDGQNPKTFIHSLKYNHYFERGGVYYRPPNHLNAIRADYAKRFKFPDMMHGEDTDYAMQIANSGLLKTEMWIEEPLYFYEYRTNKRNGN